MQPQSLSVKRAEVEFHNFASLGEPERAIATYAEENVRRRGLIRRHLPFIGRLSPFLEIGANAGHTSYMLANEFGAQGFALDISADALRYGVALMERWNLRHAPVRVAGDAVNLPFADGSIAFVMAFQTLSQFMNIESVFLEVKRVLAPGGVFFLSEEPLKRRLTAALYRCPYNETMKPWERKLAGWGLLGYLVRDVIGAHQEESFGIRQNHTMHLGDWQRLIDAHFPAAEYETFAPRRGWGEAVVARAASLGGRYAPSHLLGGTLSAFARKQGFAARGPGGGGMPGHFETFLRCPDCAPANAPLARDLADTLHCARCGYSAAEQEGVYNLLPSQTRDTLYPPGGRADVIDFSQPGHEAGLLSGFHEVEGVYGNKYRWIGSHAVAHLTRLDPGPQRLRIRGLVHQHFIDAGPAPQVSVSVNGAPLRTFPIDRSGLFVLEADLPDAPEYRLEIEPSPTWRIATDPRTLSVTLSMIRLVPRE
jgi:ubiquinone/menaquinone biosynthesis C-methylase UbiE